MVERRAIASPLFELDWVNTGAGASLQSNTFRKIKFLTSSTGVRVANTGNQGSENRFDDCWFGELGTAGIYFNGANALENTVIGGNFQNTNVGIWVHQGACETIHGVSFQLQSTCDIQVDYSGYDTYSIAGCRTESADFIKLNRASAVVSGCSQTNKTGTFIFSGGFGAVTMQGCVCGGVLAGGVPFTINGCQFNANAPTCFGSGPAGHIRDSWVNGLIDDGGSPIFIPEAWFSNAGVMYDSAQGQTSTLVDGSTVTWAVGTYPLSNVASYTIDGTGRTLTITGAVPNSTYFIYLIQGSGGSKTITTYTNFQFIAATPPALSTGAGSVDLLVVHYDGTHFNEMLFAKGEG